MRPELVARWNTPDGHLRRERLLALGLRGPWREVLVGFMGTAELGDNTGDLRGIDLTREELPGADLVRARLEGARLDDCGLIDARLDLATLSGASLTRARLDRASLTGCVALETRWDDACLEGAVLTACNLTRGSFRRARLQGARLTTTTLLNADLRCADLRGAEVSSCDLEGACVACVHRDRPRTYAHECSDKGELRYYLSEASFPSFLDAILLFPGMASIRWLSNHLVLWHVEAALEKSPDPESEIRALFQERHPLLSMVGAVALLLGGPSKRTLEALWERLDAGSGAYPQLVVTALLVDPAFETHAQARLEGRNRMRPELIASLSWALHQRRGLETTADARSSPCERWMNRLRKHVDPRFQKKWLKTTHGNTP